MQQTTCRVMAITNGYLVEVPPQPNSSGMPTGKTTTQYCADLNTVASFLVTTFVPGATYTPPPATTATTSTTGSSS